MAKNEKTIIRDYGTVNVASSWDEMNLQTFSKLQKLMTDTENKADITQVIAVLSGKDEKEINELPLSFIESIAARLTFLSVDIPKDEAKNEIEIDGEKYFINYADELSFGEYRNTQTALQNDEYDYATALAILCRKKGEKFSDFTTEQLNERARLFNAQPITKVLPLITFFLTLYHIFTNASQISTEMEQASQYVQSRERSTKSGVLHRLFTKFRKTTQQNGKPSTE